ncbi:MAG: helix-turn-helix transcriptional regulator [Planctomycetota bacterium]|jgi:AraC-like DNA-binding protein
MTEAESPDGEGRNILDLTDLGLPEIPLVGSHHLTTAVEGLPEHIHPGAMEICYLASGSRTYSVGGRDYPFKGGEIFVTFPDEEHGSGSHIHGKGVLYWIQVVLPKRPRKFLGLPGADVLPLVGALRALPRRTFRGSPRFKSHVERIFHLIRHREDALGRLEVISSLIELLALVVRCAEKAGEGGISPTMARVTEAIQAHIEEELSIESLAKLAMLSPSRFKARFRSEVGIPPGEYVLREKVNQAQSLLQTGNLSITEIAHRLNFSSSQYFATVFKRFTNQTPSESRGQSI